MASIKRRLAQEKIAKLCMQASGIIITGSLFFIIGTILYKGLPYLSWEMISQVPSGGFYIGKGGGILNAILGSLYLATAATLLSALIGIPISLYLNMYVKSGSFFARSMKLLFDVLFGIPSIVYGAIAFSMMGWFNC